MKRILFFIALVLAAIVSFCVIIHYTLTLGMIDLLNYSFSGNKISLLSGIIRLTLTVPGCTILLFVVSSFIVPKLDSYFNE